MTNADPRPGLDDFARALQKAGGFEAIARATLRRALLLVEAAVRGPGRVRVRRALLHLRGDGGYTGVWVLERGADVLSDPDPRSALLPSASVWQRLRTTEEPVAVDVTLRTMQSLDGAPEKAQWIDEHGLSDHSRGRLLERDATHTCALPLRGPAGVTGMISVEVGCRAAIGRPLAWGDCRAALEATVAVAGPYLAALAPARPPPEADPLLPVIGATMAPLVRVLRAFAAEEETLLVRGETGTGKSRIARWCHARSPRREGPFEVLDLLAVPPETQTGELFGWKRGAFTGAVRDHDGFVARAEGGTLFIDEVDKLSLEAQAALLTLLEERRYRALGHGGRRLEADVRFIVGTNADLAGAVAEGTFREDLYYRINVLPLELPPLRARADEIGPWARFMLRRCHESRRAAGAAQLDTDAEGLLEGQPWPGNLRQLDNCVRRAYTLAGLDADPGGPGRRVTAHHIRAALAFESGRRAGGDPLQPLLDAAVAFVARLAADPPGDLSAIEWPGALHGLLLGAAVLETGGRDPAFELLGYGRMVANRNHHKALLRDMARLAALAEALGSGLPPTLKALTG